MRDFVELVIIICVAGFLLFCLFFGLSAAYVVFVQGPACNSLSSMISKETKHSFWNGCFVKIDNGAWISKEAYERVTSNKHEVEVK